MVGVGVHAHHLLAHIFGRIRQIDAVAQRLAHLGLAVGAGQAQARGILREQDLGLDQRRAVHRVEFVDYLAGLLHHRLLILARGHGRRAESGDVRRLRNGIGVESDGNRLAELAHHDLALYRWVALQTGHRDEVHVIERQFAQLRNPALDEYGRLGGIDAAREIVERDFDYVLAHLVGIVGVVGERLRVGYHYENLLERARVLQLDALAERTHIVSQMELARGAVARKYYFTHRYIA